MNETASWYGSNWDTLIYSPRDEAEALKLAAHEHLNPVCRENCTPGILYKVDSSTFDEHALTGP